MTSLWNSKGCSKPRLTLSWTAALYDAWCAPWRVQRPVGI